MEDQAHKPHRKAKEKKKHSGPNPKAFSFSNPGKLQKAAVRSQDIREKRFHVPQVDRSPDEPPPRLVVIMGPPGVGKTTLLRSLIRRYTKETIQEPVGPITVVTSKKQRLTFIECPNNLEAMVDLCKVAEVVLLMIDGNYGFEMETMEFLNVLSATGMPGNVFSVLTHLDLFRKPQALRDAKKRLKTRLWTELYQGAHLFYLSGIMNGRYPDREIHNLSRFLSVMKNPRPLVFRNSHPYALMDSFRDVTHPTEIEKDEQCDRSIMLSGYLRGTNFAAHGQRIHIPGIGSDFTLASMELLPDPCPTPAMDKAMTKGSGRRRLVEKEKKLYAPFSDRSGLKVDGDAITIFREKGFTFDKDAEGERGEGEEMIIGLQGERRLLGTSQEHGVQLFSGGEQISQVGEEDTGRKSQRLAHFIDDDGASADAEILEDEQEQAIANGASENGTTSKEKKVNKTQDLTFADSDSDFGSISSGDEGQLDFDSDDDEDELDGDEGFRWKEHSGELAKRNGERVLRASDLARMMYDESLSVTQVASRWRGEDQDAGDENEADDDEDTFFKRSKQEVHVDGESRTIPTLDYTKLAKKWTEDAVEALRQKFTSIDLGGDDEDYNDEEGEEEDVEGAFVDLENNEEQGHQTEGESEPLDFEDEREVNARRKEELKSRFEEEDREGFKNPKAIARQEGSKQEAFADDEWYDAQKELMQKTKEINEAEYLLLDERQRLEVEGFKAGKYARIVISGVPAEFVKNFQPGRPLIVGGLTPIEERFGFLQLRIKKHRWHRKILKSNDPVILSVGWRRFQSLPLFSTSDSRSRNRLLKYTPEHMACSAQTYGPLIAPNSSFVCFQTLGSGNPGFRISATGTILGADEHVEMVKKLKLTGTPAKIYKNTAFIQGMFNSGLEVAKFVGAKVQTVSGLRGQIKRPLSSNSGQFRATFEDRILASDIVFLRAWYPVKPHRFYNPVTELLGDWKPMRLTGAIRHDENIPTPQQKNSQYRPIERATRHFNPLKVPRKLAASLPFKSQIVETKKRRKGQTYLEKRAVVLGGEEKKARDLMQKLTTIRKDVAEKRRAKKEQKRAVFRKQIEEMEEKRDAREKRQSKEFWSREGKKRKAGDEAGGGRKRKR